MSIYSAPTAPSIPLAAKQQKVVNRQRIRNANLLKQMVKAYTDGMGDIWENDDGMTPAQALEGFGTDATETVRRAGLLKTAINGAVPGTIADSTVVTITAAADKTYAWPPNTATGTIAIVLFTDGSGTVQTKA